MQSQHTDSKSNFEFSVEPNQLVRVRFPSKEAREEFLKKIDIAEVKIRNPAEKEQGGQFEFNQAGKVPFVIMGEEDCLFLPTYCTNPKAAPHDREFAVNFGSQKNLNSFVSALNLKAKSEEFESTQIGNYYGDGLLITYDHTKKDSEEDEKEMRSRGLTSEEYWQKTALYFPPRAEIFTKPGKILSINDEGQMETLHVSRMQRLFKQLVDKLTNRNKFMNKETVTLTTRSLEHAQDRKLDETLEAAASETVPVIHETTVKLIEDFLAHKLKYGSEKEKKLYANLNLNAFIERLLTKRPIAFLNRSDDYVLRNGLTGSRKKGEYGFDDVGTDKEKAPFLLTDYLTPDERLLSSLVGLSGSTPFINDGHKTNEGKIEDESTHEANGIYVSLVGPRLELPYASEWKYLVVSQNQNTTKNGYGLKNEEKTAQSAFVNMWSKHLGVALPTYDEVIALKKRDPKQFNKLYLEHGGHFLNIEAYKVFLRNMVEVYLGEANKRAKEQGKSAYVHAIGIGTGAWAFGSQSDAQKKIMLEVYRDVLDKNTFSNISDIDFCGFIEDSKDPKSNPFMSLNSTSLFFGSTNIREAYKGSVNIKFTNNSPAAKLTGEDKDKLKVMQVAWDGFSEIGNEFARGQLSASGDPAAACCSYIWLTQNPHVNPCISQNIQNNLTHVHGKEANNKLELESKEKPDLTKKEKESEFTELGHGEARLLIMK